MKMISTNIHGLIDYIMGILLIAIPWSYPAIYPDYALFVPSVVGTGIILYSIFTRYERGLIKIIPMSVHLSLDVMAAIILGISPWIFGFNKQVFLPHVLISIFMLIIIICSSYEPFVEKRITESYNRN